MLVALKLRLEPCRLGLVGTVDPVYPRLISLGFWLVRCSNANTIPRIDVARNI